MGSDEAGAVAANAGGMTTLIEEVKRVDELLDEAVFEPDPARTDWNGMRARLGMLREALTTMLGVLDEALAEAEDDEVRELIRRKVAVLLGSAVAVFHAAGDAVRARELLLQAIARSPDAEQKAELEAGRDEIDSFCRLKHAIFLLRNGKRNEADRLAKGVARATRKPALKALARKITDAPRPITSAPALFRLNGCGFGLYFERDREPDGSYIATYCFCLLWIPLIPISAYRVRQVDSSSYQFGSQEVLGPIASMYRKLLGVAAVVGIVGVAVTSYLQSPERLGKIALAEAQAAEKVGDREKALEGYRGVITTYATAIDAEPAAEALVRLHAAGIAEPCPPDATDKIAKVVSVYDTLPTSCRQGAARSRLIERLRTWAGQIGDGDPARAEASLTVLDMALTVGEVAPEKEAIAAQAGKLRRSLADKLAAERPLRALTLYVAMPRDPEAMASARTILEGFGEAPSLWLEAEPQVTAWIDASIGKPQAKLFRERLASARADHASDVALIESGDEKELRKAFSKAPFDQELGVALAGLTRRAGKVDEALALVNGLGPPGRLTGAAQQLLGACHADKGDLRKADAVLTSFLAERLSPFLDAQRAYSAAAQSLQKRLVDDAKAGRIDHLLEVRLQGKSDKEQGALFNAWLVEQIETDAQLGKLRTAFLRHEAVVPASLSLGMVKLRRANEAAGGERKALLDEAERVFLSIRQEAEGDPSYHLGIGSVYHRLGRIADGNAELDRVLARKDPSLTIAVVSTYRELGLPARAKEIAEQLYGSATDEHVKHSAAEMMARLSTEVGFDEAAEESWLRKANQDSPRVKNDLQNLEARRLAREGRYPEADRVYAKVIEAHEKAATHDASAANNAAIVYLSRYGVTGDPAHLRTAIRHLESATRLSPESAMIVGNLADAHEYLATVTLLERWVRTRTLLLAESDARSLLEELAAGPLHDEIVGSLRRDPSQRRSLDLSQTEQTLAPQKRAGYRRQLAWLGLSDDEAGLGELLKRLEAAPPFDAEATGRERKLWITQSRGEAFKVMAQKGVDRSRERLARAERAKHDPTTAAAWMLLGEDLQRRVFLGPTREGVDGPVDAFRKAANGTPEDRMDTNLTSALVLRAFDHAAARSPGLQKAWEDDRNTYSLSDLLLRAVSAPDGAAIRDGLRADPDLIEAVKLSKIRAAKRPRLGDVILARASGDEELERLASGAFSRKDLGLTLAIEVKLYPGQAREQADLELFRKGASR